MDDSTLLNPIPDVMASPSIQPRFSGAILAGGLSRRMGRDKALLQVDGESLLARQVRLLRAAGATEVLLSQSPDRPRPKSALPPDVRLIWDDPTANAAGPLGVLATVIAAATSDWVAVSAVDLPALTVEWWRSLLRRTSPGVGVVGQRPDGDFEPLAAVYPRIALGAIRQQLASGNRALQHLITAGIAAGWIQVWPIPTDQLPLLRNWNCPTD